MLTTNANHIAALLTVAQAAIDHQRATDKAKDAKEGYREACRQWKEAHGFDRYDKISVSYPAAFDAMIAATEEEHGKAQVEKRAEYNAKRRLWTAIRRAEAA
ncbi:hypothetical protein H0A66_03790 [Alcaligenaceae bacterium]|nr:hypothetical protein [Alcaligenaceae bacterium]